MNWYRRMFLSENTALVAAAFSVLLLPAIYWFGTRASAIDWANCYELLLRMVLAVTLFYALKTHKLFLMQAATVGLLFTMLCGQSRYVLGDLCSRDSETYITMGVQGFIFLTRELVILFMQSFVCINHFIIFGARRQESIRVSVNQGAILFLLACLCLQLAITPTLSFGRDYILYVFALHLDELFIFMLTACAELVLMIDQREYAGG